MTLESYPWLVLGWVVFAFLGYLVTAWVVHRFQARRVCQLRPDENIHEPTGDEFEPGGSH